MANLEVIALDTVTPQLRAPGVGDGYLFARQASFSQNVGIGTTTPGQKLDVNGTVNIAGIIYGGSGASNSIQFASTSGNSNRSGITIGNVINSDNGGISFSTAGASVETVQMRISGISGNISLGLNSATPLAKILSGNGSRAGVDTNIGGGDLTIYPGTGTGTGAVASLILQSPVAVGSGSNAQTQTTGLTIKNGCAVPRATTVASLPAAASNTDAMLIVTDALTTLALGIGTAVVGGGANRVGVRSDGTNWIYSF